MKESVIYQEILLEGKAEGKAEGIVEGIAEGKTKEREKIALNMIRSNISVDLVAQFTGLTDVTWNPLPPAPSPIKGEGEQD